MALNLQTLPVDSTTKHSELVHYNDDKRVRVQNTAIYPHNAIARMKLKFYGHIDANGVQRHIDANGVQKYYGGTGFVTDGGIFITAAHCVRDEGNGCQPAEEVTLFFGLDGATNQGAIEPIVLTGNDFTVGTGFKRGTDSSDIAWIDLTQYVNRKATQGIVFKWSLDELLKRVFYKCKIPDTSVEIPGAFNISGNYKFLM